MDEATRSKYLRIALLVIGVVLVIGIYPLILYWPSGWRWEPYHPEYEQMIVGIYATLGVFLILAARNPVRYLSVIWFTVWSSIVHGGIMLIHALQSPAERGHLIGDVPALFIVAGVLAWLAPRRKEITIEGGSS